MFNTEYAIILDLAPCYSNPCEHGGHCVPIDGGKSYHCYCGAYWTGDRCQCKYIQMIETTHLNLIPNLDLIH